MGVTDVRMKGGGGRMGKELTADVIEAKRKKMRSAVRVCITCGAGTYLVLDGVLLMARRPCLAARPRRRSTA